MAVDALYPHITSDAGQSPRLSWHPRVRVAQIAMDYIAHGWSAEEMCRQYPHLQPSEVHTALAYYYDHRQQIDNEIQQETDAVKQSRSASPVSPFAALRSRGERGA